MLPDEFIDSMRGKGWAVPNGLEQVPPRIWDFDYGFWLHWSRQHRRRHWLNIWRLVTYRAGG